MSIFTIGSSLSLCLCLLSVPPCHNVCVYYWFLLVIMSVFTIGSSLSLRQSEIYAVGNCSVPLTESLFHALQTSAKTVIHLVNSGTQVGKGDRRPSDTRRDANVDHRETHCSSIASGEICDQAIISPHSRTQSETTYQPGHDICVRWP